MKRVFTIGEHVWFEQDHMSGWGKVGLINREDSFQSYNCTDDDIITVVKDDGGEIECTPDGVYQLAPGITFFGHIVVWDHFSEEYPLFCPARQENLYMVETDQYLPQITDKPHSYEFYVIEDDYIHVSAYLWHDEDRGWVLTEFTFCYVPREEFLNSGDGLARQFCVERYEEGSKQYEEDGLTEEEALDICNHYAHRMRLLDYEDVTKDTENGNYVTKVR